MYEWYNAQIMKWRILYNIIIFVSISLFTWPVYTSLLLAGIFFFRSFYESIIWLLVIEIVLGPIGVGISGHYYLLLVSGLLLCSAWIKKVMRYYE